MIPANVDQFLCCGKPYRAVREAVAQVLVENRSDVFMTEIQVRETPDMIGRLMKMFIDPVYEQSTQFGGTTGEKRLINDPASVLLDAVMSPNDHKRSERFCDSIS